MRPLAALLALLALTATSRAADPNGPKRDDFDYAKLIDTHQRLVAEGKSREAVEFPNKRSFNPDGANPAAGAELQKKFALVFGGGGTVVGHELVGYKRITSRAYRFYAVTHFDRSAVTYGYLFYKTGEDGWRLSSFSIREGIDEAEKVAPFTPLEPRKAG